MILKITTRLTENEKRSLRRYLDREIRIGKQVVSFNKPGTGNYEVFVDNSEMFDDDVSDLSDLSTGHQAIRRLMIRLGRTFDYELTREGVGHEN